MEFELTASNGKARQQVPWDWAISKAGSCNIELLELIMRGCPCASHVSQEPTDTGDLDDRS